MSALSSLKELGVEVFLTPGGKLKLRGSGPAETKAVALDYCRRHREAILAQLAGQGQPGQCESCPAAGYWEYAQYSGRGLMCFHYAYFLGKPGKPKPCQQARADCPRK